MKLALTENDVAKVEMQLDQAGDILLEINELVADNEAVLASALLRRYKDKTDGIALNITDENVSDVKDRFEEIISQQAEHMKTLTAILLVIVGFCYKTGLRAILLRGHQIAQG